nr:hypothetical protein [uncultured bacterium]
MQFDSESLRNAQLFIYPSVGSNLKNINTHNSVCNLLLAEVFEIQIYRTTGL